MKTKRIEIHNSSEIKLISRKKKEKLSKSKEIYNECESIKNWSEFYHHSVRSKRVSLRVHQTTCRQSIFRSKRKMNMKSFFAYKDRILTPQQLKRLTEHSYSCTNSSLLDPWLQPWWNCLVSKTPLWLAPNLITIVGLIINIVTTLILIA